MTRPKRRPYGYKGTGRFRHYLSELVEAAGLPSILPRSLRIGLRFWSVPSDGTITISPELASSAEIDEWAKATQEEVRLVADRAKRALAAAKK